MRTKREDVPWVSRMSSAKGKVPPAVLDSPIAALTARPTDSKATPRLPLSTGEVSATTSTRSKEIVVQGPNPSLNDAIAASALRPEGTLIYPASLANLPFVLSAAPLGQPSHAVGVGIGQPISRELIDRNPHTLPQVARIDTPSSPGAQPVPYAAGLPLSSVQSRSFLFSATTSLTRQNPPGTAKEQFPLVKDTLGRDVLTSNTLPSKTPKPIPTRQFTSGIRSSSLGSIVGQGTSTPVPTAASRVESKLAAENPHIPEASRERIGNFRPVSATRAPGSLPKGQDLRPQTNLQITTLSDAPSTDSDTRRVQWNASRILRHNDGSVLSATAGAAPNLARRETAKTDLMPTHHAKSRQSSQKFDATQLDSGTFQKETVVKSNLASGKTQERVRPELPGRLTVEPTLVRSELNREDSAVGDRRQDSSSNSRLGILSEMLGTNPVRADTSRQIVLINKRAQVPGRISTSGRIGGFEEFGLSGWLLEQKKAGYTVSLYTSELHNLVLQPNSPKGATKVGPKVANSRGSSFGNLGKGKKQ